VIGVNSAIYSPTGGSVGIGFAIPSQLAANVVGQLKDHGRTRRGWLGVRIQTVTDELAESLSLPKSRGALVASVQDDSPAKKAGIEPGDVIVTFAGKEVTAMRGLPRLVAEHAINADAKVELWRKGKTMTVTVKVGELDEKEQVAAVDPKAAPPAAAAGDRAQALGLTFAALNPDLRKKFDIKENVKGVVVTEVAPNSDAAQQGIRPGDVIVGINGEDVAAPKDVAEKVKKVQSAKRNSVALFVERAGDRRWVAVKLGEG
jgi:serine protease Do